MACSSVVKGADGVVLRLRGVWVVEWAPARLQRAAHQQWSVVGHGIMGRV